MSINLHKPKGIPDDIFNAKLIKIVDAEVIKIHEELTIINRAFNLYFRLYRVFANISMIALTSAVFTFFLNLEGYLIVSLFAMILTAIISYICLSVSEDCINAIIQANIKRDTMVHEKAFEIFSEKVDTNG